MKRMKQLAFAAGVLLAGAGLGTAFAQTDLPSITQNRATVDSKLDHQFAEMDSNHDGQVSKAEYDHYWQQQFRRSDTNHDHKLSQAEARAGAKRLNGGKLPKKNRFDLRWNEVSHDGFLTAPQALAWHDRLFREADADGNGSLSRTEMRRALRARNLNVGSL